MKIKCLLGLTALVLGSCAKLMDLPLQDNEDEPRSLEVSVYHEPISKGRIDGNYLPPSSEIGVFVSAMDGGLYNGQALDNIRYSASGTESGQTWIMDSATPIELYALKAKAYAYYPRINESISIKQIPLINDGTDWMYTEIPAMNLSNKQPLAQLKMVHAMTIVRCRLIKDDYEGPGVIQGLGVQSEGLAKSAVLDLSTSTFSSYGEQGRPLFLNDVGTLGDEPVTADIWAVPTQVASDFTVVILLGDVL